MIIKKSRRWIGFLKTTAIGGLLFLLPLAVLAAIVSQIAPIVYNATVWFNGHLPMQTPASAALVGGISIATLLLLCFAAGLIAKWSIGMRVAGLFEKNLLLLFPRYTILKDQMTDTIGGKIRHPLKPVLVRLNDRSLIGFEAERSEDGMQVVVYCPGSPDTWSGSLTLLDATRVEPLRATLSETVSICEQLGRGTLSLIRAGSDDGGVRRSE